MVKTKDAFSALSMKDRAELINIYVKGGMMDLKEIKKHYNSLYDEQIETNKYGWGGASKDALGKAFSDASSSVSSVGGIAGSAMTMVSNGMENAEINTTEADNAIEAVKSHTLDNSSLDALAASYNATPWSTTDFDSSNFTKSGWEIAGNTFESTLSGITTGASVGGPWGAVIGGLAGLGSGLIGWGVGEAKAEEAERRLEAQAKAANRAIELNAVNTRDSILQRQANNTLRNIAADGGRLLKGDEKEQTLSGKSFWQKLLESGQSGRDARVGAVGAQQVRDLYNDGKTEEASELAKKYAKANTTGIALAGGAASPSLLGDLIVTGATTTADTLLEGNLDNLGWDLLINGSMDALGHGAGKVINYGIQNVSDWLKYQTKYRKHLGRLMDFTDSKLPVKEGAESTVYIDKDFVHKVMDQGVREMTPEELIKFNDNFVSNRNLPPHVVPIEVEGVVKGQTKGKYYPVYKQEKVKVVGDASMPSYEWEKHKELLDKKMLDAGWTTDGGSYYYNKELNKHVSDISPMNTGYKNGEIVIIDGEVYKQGGKLNKLGDGGGGRFLDGTEEEQTLSGNNIDTSIPLESRENYLNKQRQSIIDASLERSRTRTKSTIPWILEYENELAWRREKEFQLEENEQYLDRAIKFNHDKDIVKELQLEIEALNNELSNGYEEKLIPGAACIYTATDNYGKEYRVASNQEMYRNPEKYGFKRINPEKALPGDILQIDLTHAVTFDHLNEDGQVVFNQSKGGREDVEVGRVAASNGFSGFSNAYRFVGRDSDNKKWNNEYNQYRKDYGNKVLEELKKVPQLPTDKVRILKGDEDEQTLTGNQPLRGMESFDKKYFINQDDNYVPSPTIIPSNNLISFFEDYANRYNKEYDTNQTEHIINRVKNTNPSIGELPPHIGGQFNIFTEDMKLQDHLDESTFAHELSHKLNDYAYDHLYRSKEEYDLIRQAYDTINGELFKGASDHERFATNTGLRKTISEEYGNVLGEELNKVIENLHPKVLLDLYDRENAYTNKDNYIKHVEGINSAEDLYNRLYSKDNKFYKDLSEQEKKRWEEIYKNKRITVGTTIDKDKINILKKALIRIADNNTNKKEKDVNYAANGGKLKFDKGGYLLSTPYNNSFLYQPETQVVEEEPIVENTYTVKQGDSLSKIANSFNLPLELLKKENPMKDYNRISIGQSLKIPKYEQPEQVVQPVISEDFDVYNIKQGDTLSKIAKDNNTSVSKLLQINPQIKNENVINVGQSINLRKEQKPVEVQKKWVNVEELREQEKEFNKSNLGAIQGYKHDSNYIVVDKKGKKLTVYNANNEKVYETSDISTGLSGDDYNTVTYTKKVNGKDVIDHGKGNMSTPAGITKISSITDYHGAPAFQRARLNGEGNIRKVKDSETGELIDDNVASSFHSGRTAAIYSSNGCVRMSNKALKELSNYVDVGTTCYTLPDKEGSRFVLKDGNLNFEADNPFGLTEKNVKFNAYGKDIESHDDYNVHIDRRSTPIKIEYDGWDGILGVRGNNIDKLIDGIVSNKAALQKAFKISDQHYNKIAHIALGLIGQESKYGTHRNYIAKKALSSFDIGLLDEKNPQKTGITGLDVAKYVMGNNTYDSLGMGQIKMEGDNEETQRYYKMFGVTPENVYSDEKTAEAIMIRLLSMYNNEVRGRKFKDKETEHEVDSYDALLYFYKGGDMARVLRSGEAIVGRNTYVNAVKDYMKNFKIYTYK